MTLDTVEQRVAYTLGQLVVQKEQIAQALEDALRRIKELEAAQPKPDEIKIE